MKSVKEEWITSDTCTHIREKEDQINFFEDCKENTELKTLSESYRYNDR